MAPALSAPITGGAGVNTFNTDIATIADLGAVTGFQTLLKTGSGTLSINGPVTSVFDSVLISNGVVYVSENTTVDPVTTVVGAGGTLQVDGNYLGTAGSDTMTVAGTVSGTGNVDLGLGDDELTLNDGAMVSAIISGGGQVLADTLILNNAAAMSVDGAATTDFETLTKRNTGVATLTGAQGYSAGARIDAGTLAIAGTLDAPTIALADGSILDVLGTVQAAGATATALSGSAGVNIVRVASGATLIASGDLGDGADVLDIAGMLQADALDLGAGHDMLTIHDGTIITGTVAGGAGNNTLNSSIAGVADLAVLSGFQSLLKSGAGTLNIHGAEASAFTTVIASAGVLNVAAAGSVADVSNTFVVSGATLNVDGAYRGSDYADSFTVAGRVSGAGTVSLEAGDDRLSLRDGAVLDANIDGGTSLETGDTLLLDTAGAFSLDADRVTSFEILTKRGPGVATLVGPSMFSAGVNIDAGTLVSTATLTAGVTNIATAGTLSASGLIVGDVTNAGVLNTGPMPFGTLTIRGNYTGVNGRLDMRVALGDDNSQTDVLGIDGGNASGTTRVRVLNQGGLGARTSGSGIQLVETSNGASTADDAFTLDSPVMAGAYQYDLFHGAAGDADPQGWYLRSLEPLRDMASLATALVPLAHTYGLALIGTLHDREGADLRESCDGSARSGCQWGRLWYRSGEHDGGGTTLNGADFDYDMGGLQIGTDINPGGDRSRGDRVGMYFSIGRPDADARRDDGTAAGTMQATAYSLAAYWTHRNPQRWYMDSTLFGTYLDNLEIDASEDADSETHGWSMGGSIEGGRSLRIGTHGSLQLQAQVIAQHIEQADTQAPGTKIHFDDANTIVGRIGLAFGMDIDPRLLSTWLRANYWSELAGDTQTRLAADSAAPTILSSTFDDDWIELSAGIAARINSNASVNASVTTSQGVGDSDSRALQGTLGFKVQW